ncbi:hypothetical protein [Limosilactobacillus pulli]|uniref:hypothetical protein n=1 Tax=Limosilactobacillus pulli TaxID=2991833 RepID=UPI0024B95630|nr:hypothetical protein [Limosilactobacillus pulli]
MARTIALTMGPAYTLAFSIKIKEWDVPILAMLRTCSDALKNRACSRFLNISKNKIAGLDAYNIWGGDYLSLMNGLFDRAIKVEQWQLT